MRVLHLAAIAAVLAAPVSGIGLFGDASRDLANAAIGTVSEPMAFRLTVIGRDADCVLRAGETMVDDLRPLDVSVGCAAFDLGLSAASLWREGAHGTVALVDPDGRTIAEFGASDGAAYESFRPVEPMMLLTAGG